MIVNYTQDGWEVVTQRAHGLLAMQLAMEWKTKDRPSRWAETLLAIAEHDDAEVELDGENLLTPQGGPLNFNMKIFDPEHCERLYDLSVTKSRYIALLTSLHMDFLYRKEASANTAAKIFLSTQQALRKQWQKELGLTTTESKGIYSMLEWCDALSLLICQQLMQLEKRSIEVSKGPRQLRYQLYLLGNNTLTICPWPFQSTKFMVSYESRMLTKIKFSNSMDFRKSFREAAVTDNIWQIKKAPAPDQAKKHKQA